MNSEKELIEKTTADAFIALYNLAFGTTYKIVEYSDAPDIRCRNAIGEELNLEITLTEDRPGDIPAILGRSQHKSHDSQRAHLEKVKAGKASIFEQVSSLSGNASETLAQRILAKSNKDYGANVALVIRDSSPAGWDWEHITSNMKSCLGNTRLPFQRGVWLITYTKDRIIQIV